MSQSSLAIGQVVAGRYRVERLIGRGGMGEVAAVRHVDLDEVFALKVMTPEAFVSQEAVDRFIREARTSAKLRSIHAVKVVDTGRLSDGAPYLVMEYLRGRDLDAELRARGPLPPAEVAAYMVQACDVLAEAHAAGIVHRDLKPANLFLTRLPNGGACLKVLDFGIAKQIDPHNRSAMTQTNSVFGTPLYMSPEHMKSAKLVDHRADIWSLGVVMYELLTGLLPYDAESMTALVIKVMSEPPTPLAARRAGIPAGLDRVVMRCLERDASRRWSSAAELAAALAPFAGQVDMRASVPDLGGPSRGPAIQIAPAITGPDPNPTYTGATQMAVASPAGGSPHRAGSRAPLIGIAAALAIASAAFVTFALRGTGGDGDTRAAATGSAEVAPPKQDAPVVSPASPEAPAPPSSSSAEPAATATAATTTTPTAATTAAPARPTATAAHPTPKPTARPTAAPAKTRGGFL